MPQGSVGISELLPSPSVVIGISVVVVAEAGGTYFRFVPYGDWFVGLSEMSRRLAWLATAAGVLPSFNPITRVGVLPEASPLSCLTSEGDHGFPVFLVDFDTGPP